MIMSGKASKAIPPSSYSAGARKSSKTHIASLQFIVTTPTHDLDQQDRKAIKGNATRKRKSQRRIPEIQSWIVPGNEPASLRGIDTVRRTAIPKRAGTDFSGLQLPAGFEPHMIQELIKGKRLALLSHSGVSAILTGGLKDSTSVRRQCILTRYVLMCHLWNEAGSLTCSVMLAVSTP